MSDDVEDAPLRLLQRAEREFTGLEDDVPPVLFHYTDATGLLGIVTDGSIRATDARFFSDRDDYAYGRRLVAELATERAANETGSARRILESLGTFVLEKWSRYWHPRYVVSFTPNGDLLSQWRAYAADGAGYSIGVEAKVLGITWAMAVAYVVRVEYDRDEQRRIIGRYIDQALECAEGLAEPLAMAGALQEALWLHQLRFKNPGFSEEQEWRAIILPSIATAKDYPLRFRATNRGVIPFLELPIVPVEGGNWPAIKKVIVGPRIATETGLAGARELLKARGICAAAEEEIVTCSATPYR